MKYILLLVLGLLMPGVLFAQTTSGLPKGVPLPSGLLVTGPGGCTNLFDCKLFCQVAAHKNECSDFARNFKVDISKITHIDFSPKDISPDEQVKIINHAKKVWPAFINQINKIESRVRAMENKKILVSPEIKSAVLQLKSVATNIKSIKTFGDLKVLITASQASLDVINNQLVNSEMIAEYPRIRGLVAKEISQLEAESQQLKNKYDAAKDVKGAQQVDLFMKSSLKLLKNQLSQADEAIKNRNAEEAHTIFIDKLNLGLAKGLIGSYKDSSAPQDALIKLSNEQKKIHTKLKELSGSKSDPMYKGFVAIVVEYDKEVANFRTFISKKPAKEDVTVRLSMLRGLQSAMEEQLMLIPTGSISHPFAPKIIKVGLPSGLPI
ncbi:hypothetical protein HY224_02295 [Candidatus Uhrbacteria bacterium]|nr:hypothetical protein [Candidatus Uhrbacteria bacterium]